MNFGIIKFFFEKKIGNAQNWTRVSWARSRNVIHCDMRPTKVFRFFRNKNVAWLIQSRFSSVYRTDASPRLPQSGRVELRRVVRVVDDRDAGGGRGRDEVASGVEAIQEHPQVLQKNQIPGPVPSSQGENWLVDNHESF